jgi:hypothetical protein
MPRAKSNSKLQLEVPSEVPPKMDIAIPNFRLRSTFPPSRHFRLHCCNFHWADHPWEAARRSCFLQLDDTVADLMMMPFLLRPCNLFPLELIAYSATRWGGNEPTDWAAFCCGGPEARLHAHIVVASASTRWKLRDGAARHECSSRLHQPLIFSCCWLWWCGVLSQLAHQSAFRFRWALFLLFVCYAH